MVSIGVTVHDPPAPEFRLLECTDIDGASVVLKIGDVAIFAPGSAWLDALARVAASAATELEGANRGETSDAD